MAYDRKHLAVEIRRQLALGYDPARLARWARRATLAHRRDASRDARLYLQKVRSMAEGPEFELAEVEFLQLLADLEATPDSPQR